MQQCHSEKASRCAHPPILIRSETDYVTNFDRGAGPCCCRCCRGAWFFHLGGENRKRTAEAKIGSAEEEAKRIVNDAIKAAEQKRKETIIEAKDEAFKLKSDADKEIKDRRAEITRQERRIDQKEEALDKRTAQMAAQGGGPQAPQ